MSTERRSPDEILQEAKTFYNEVTQTGKLPTWSDYERFKKMLHHEGLFGYEYRLANILHL